MPRAEASSSTNDVSLLAAVAPSSMDGERPMQLFVKTVTSRTIRLSVAGSSNIARVKEVILMREGIPLDQQNIYSASGQLLEDGQTLNDCGVCAESNLQLRLAGDAPPSVHGPSSRCRYGVVVAVGAVVLCVVVAVRTLGSGKIVHACNNNPCGRHEKCTPSNDGKHTCTCESGWKGVDCAIPTGCYGQPCGTHGRCNATADGGAYQCSCVVGWAGDNCDCCMHDQPSPVFTGKLSGSIDNANGSPHGVSTLFDSQPCNGTDPDDPNGIYPNPGSTVTFTPTNPIVFNSSARINVLTDINGAGGSPPSLEVAGSHGRKLFAPERGFRGWVDVSSAGSPLISVRWSRASSGGSGTRVCQIDARVRVPACNVTQCSTPPLPPPTLPCCHGGGASGSYACCAGIGVGHGQCGGACSRGCGSCGDDENDCVPWCDRFYPGWSDGKCDRSC
jgi:hypothetical protein